MENFCIGARFLTNLCKPNVVSTMHAEQGSFHWVFTGVVRCSLMIFLLGPPLGFFKQYDEHGRPQCLHDKPCTDTGVWPASVVAKLE